MSGLFLLSGLILLSVACSGSDPQTSAFEIDGIQVQVTYFGRVSNENIFGRDGSLIDRLAWPDADSAPGKVEQLQPDWLEFEYRIGSDIRHVLVARQPLLRDVSWSQIARAGAALGDESRVAINGAQIRQNAMVQGADGRSYRIRLPTCGDRTLAGQSEWNLLIGGVHKGDVDFNGSRYGWIARPFSDAGLVVGQNGSLSWCQEAWDHRRVARGYFYVSRFLASDPEASSERLAWRPVLEVVDSLPAGNAESRTKHVAEVSPNGRVRYFGMVANAELFGESNGIESRLTPNEGLPLGLGRPDWLKFEVDGREMLIAQQPVRTSISWNAVARVGAATGDDRWVRAGLWFYRQNATVEDVSGQRYRVRLLDCGEHTLDHQSEWNRLIGAVHQGDGDFVAHPSGFYGWVDSPMDDRDLHFGDISDRLGGSTWCRNRLRIGFRTFAVNRGYLTVSRFHATEPGFVGTGFGWRPVLVRVE